MNAGRLLFSDPRPYDSQAPIDGRPACCDPVWKNVIAGSWLIASVCIDLTMHSSSTILRRVRQQLADPRARLAVLRELELRAGHRERRWNAVMPVSRCPMRTDAGSSWPFILRSSGL